MNDVTRRFFNSIHIDNIDDFDVEFDYIQKDRFRNNHWHMSLRKDSAWTYHLLRQLQDALSYINYSYDLSFTYVIKPSAEDALNLFNDWYQTIYRLPSEFILEINEDDSLSFIFESEEELNKNKDVVDSFNDFINSFLNYDVVINSLVREKGVSLSKRKMNQIRRAALSSATEFIESDSEDIHSTAEDISETEDLVIKEPSENEEEKIEEENESNESMIDSIEAAHQNEIDSALDAHLKEYEKNYQNMMKERERARLNRRGNYKHVELIDSITASDGNVDFDGKCFSVDDKEFGGNVRVTLGVSDIHGGCIYVDCYTNNQFTNENLKELKENRFSNVRIKGAAYNSKNGELHIKGHTIAILPPTPARKDTYDKKRVELHLHSTMSVQDGVTNMMTYCKLAKEMGHTAIAITDHGVAQGFPDAQAASKATGVKILYGCELYMVDDKQIYVFNPANIKLSSAKYVVLDLETTGLSTYYDRIIEFGAVKVEGGLVSKQIDLLINPEMEISKKISDITHISQDMVKDKPTIDKAIDQILDFIGDSIIVTHNASFDFGFLQETLKRLGRPILHNPVIDTLALSRYMFPESKAHRLGALCRRFEINYNEDDAHRADYDAKVLNDVWQPMLASLTKHHPSLTHEELGKLETPKELLKHIRPIHVTALVKNKVGLKNLYKLISLAHVEYFAQVPKIPRSEVEKYKEGLILGSACFNGEVFNTARYYNFDRLKQVIDFYDFIEVQPPENYSFLINTNEISSEEYLQTLLKDIIRAADEMHKPVCATGDVHYANPEDKVFRDVYISSPQVGGGNHPLNPFDREKGKYGIFENPDQHYRTTDEMVEAFSFLNDEKKVLEMVVDNTNIIADQIETLVPLPNDHLYTPTIENCENDLTNLVYKNAKERYGDPLPAEIEERLKKELNGIISNGYSVIYWIAHKLIKKTNEDGYIVGSRGSVGSSFVATMADITEVNPLPPHYICPHCHHFEWGNKEYPDIRSGYDLPAKKCPVCGEELVREGQNIPFETFLGFNAEKVPDIDLNFSGEYQAEAHNYTKVLLGEKNVFRAGTIETVADKTAFGFARGYIERQYILEGKSKEEAKLLANKYPRAKLSYLASGCIDVKRTTGQHPGGIVVVPQGYEVYDFTPVQYPADEVDSSWMTTHFSFKSIHDTILKLDLLGHVDPTAMKMMKDLTGVKIEDIPMNDKRVLSLFSSPKELGLKRNYLNQTTGAMMLPEFGTPFVRGILEETRPTTFDELLSISGLSHGTNVWNGNAQDLIKDKITTLRGAIGCRDDIMSYLISKGLPHAEAFAIMEKVRKGKGLSPEYIEDMRANDVPDYYINSCQKIKYLFPRGHACAYVMMAVRVAYFKLYYPLEFYATFFSVRSKQYEISTMIKGENAIIERLEELRRKERDATEILSPKEEQILKTLENAVEMTERGYSFGNIDLYRSEASNFVVDHERKCLIPPFSSLDGLGEAAANSVVEARKNGEFLSKQDLLERTQLTSTNVANLTQLGALDGLSDTNQLNLFDFC